MSYLTLFRGCGWSLTTIFSVVAVEYTTRALSQWPHVTSKLEWAGAELWKNETHK